MTNENAENAADVEVKIFFNETPTYFLFQQQSSIADLTSPEAEEIKKANQRYEEYTPISVSDRSSYTFHNFTKDKISQTVKVNKANKEIQLDLHRLVSNEEEKKKKDTLEPIDILRESCHPLASNNWESTTEEALRDDSVKIDFGPNSKESVETINGFKNFAHTLFVIERMVQQNIHLEKILNYSSPQSTSEQPGIESLLKFSCSATYSRKVTGLSFNPQSISFFAASYGKVPDSASSQSKKTPSPGLICIWNILNPGQPERIFETPSVPTSIVFSEGVPYLLAAGFSDGSVGLYDIRSKPCECIAMSTVETGSHEGEVGEVVFHLRTDTRVRSEAVVSVAAGGRVTQWAVANGLEHKDLVILKKLKAATKEGEPQTLRYEDLHCVSFSSSQPNLYVVGSEDGALFVCDTQYNEDFVQKLLFHFRSVLTVKFSPITPNWFISGSCDGSAAIWNTQKTTPFAVFYLTKANFNSVSWSPISSTVFAAACSDGECRIWDISVDSVDPVAILSTYEKKEFTAIDWSPKLPVFISGNTAGSVYLSKVVGVQSLLSGNSTEEERTRFETVIQTLSNQE